MYYVINMRENQIVASFDYRGEAQGYVNSNKFEHANVALIIVDEEQVKALGCEK